MKKRLLLIDGSGFLYRAFHALPDLRNAAGRPTGAVYGFLNMLHRLERDYAADYAACVFDARGKTFRHELYDEYKATRPKMPDDLAEQLSVIQDTVKLLGWPVLSVTGVEADDVIATLAKKAAAEGIETVVSTGDKDLAQIVTPDVFLVNTMTNEVLDTEGVENKFGVPPEKIVDYLSLIGDTSDNVPGVSKVGPKTALKWLGLYGSLDGVIGHSGEIGGAVGKNLRDALAWLPRTRQLITIKDDVEIGGFESVGASLKRGEQDRDALTKLYRANGFKSLLKYVDPGQGGTADKVPTEPAKREPNPDLFSATGEGTAGYADYPPFVATRRYETVMTEEALSVWAARVMQAELTAVDTETTSLSPMDAKLVGISLCCEAGHACYIPVGHTTLSSGGQLPAETVLAALKPWLEDPSKKKVGQNIKYDMHIFANCGIALDGIAHDTMLESYVLDSHLRHDMDTLAERVFGYTPVSYESVCGKGAGQIPFSSVEIDRATDYAAEDADVTFQLHTALYPRLRNEPSLLSVYEDIEMPALLTLFEMERNGVLIDTGKLSKQAIAVGTELDALGKQAYEIAGEPFNLNSPKQLADILFEKNGLPVIKKTPGGAPSTNEEVLEKLALDFPLPKVILQHRSLSKLKSTYIDKLPKTINVSTGRVHTSFSQSTAVTGRLSSSEPNLQNIPVRTAEGRRIREAFVAPAGSLIVSADYSQIELRLMAHLSGDETLKNAFLTGGDVHRATAGEIFGVAFEDVTGDQRRAAKTINFGLMYGMSAFGLAQNLQISRTQAQQYIDLYFSRYSGVARFMQDIVADAQDKGYVETLFGRRIALSDIASKNPAKRAGAERLAINAPMQGTAADIIKRAMVAVSKWLKDENLKTKMILQVHDELVFEVPESELAVVTKAVPELMAGAARLSVPLTAEIGSGTNWDEAH